MKNKKIIAISVVAVCIIALFALFLFSGNAGYEMSVTDTATKEKISLGESRESVEDKVGEPDDERDFLSSTLFYYDDEDLSIVYDSNDCVAYIDCSGKHYSTLKHIIVGADGEEAYKKALGKDAKSITHKAIRFYGDVNNSKAISENELKSILEDKGINDIYVMSFGVSTTDDTIERISIGNYKTVMYGQVD